MFHLNNHVMVNPNCLCSILSAGFPTTPRQCWALKNVWALTQAFWSGCYPDVRNPALDWHEALKVFKVSEVQWLFTFKICFLVGLLALWLTMSLQYFGKLNDKTIIWGWFIPPMYGHSECSTLPGVDSAAAAVGDAHGTARDPWWRQGVAIMGQEDTAKVEVAGLVNIQIAIENGHL